MPQAVHVIDSHTAGEPTRVVISGGPDLGNGTVAQQAEVWQRSHDLFRSAVVNEPRGSDVLVGALLVPPADPACAAGVIFFNNVGTLGMCGHGMIGVVVTLERLGRIGPGTHRVETPVGVVTAILDADGGVSIENVPSWRTEKDAAVTLPDGRLIRGDVAWGGNWFFLFEAHDHVLSLERARALTDFAWSVRRAANAQGFPEVDHIELTGPPVAAGADARNFVLCPGGAYDRSPCGTGTSARLACLAADGTLAEATDWVQEGILGTTFASRYTWLDRAAGKIIPTIHGTAHVTAEAALHFDEHDPFRWGIR